MHVLFFLSFVKRMSGQEKRQILLRMVEDEEANDTRFMDCLGWSHPLSRSIVENGGDCGKVALDESLKAVFGTAPEEKTAKVPVRPRFQELSQARDLLKKAEEALKQGKWQDFGKGMQELQRVLGPQPTKQ